MRDEYGCEKEFDTKSQMHIYCIPGDKKYYSYKKASPEKCGELAIYRFKGLSIEDVS